MFGHSKLRESILFSGFSIEETVNATNYLGVKTKQYQKKEKILSAGDIAKEIGVVLDGSVTIENNDIWGNRTILSKIGKGEIFAESFALIKDTPMLVDVIAETDCAVAFFNVDKMQNFQTPLSEWQLKLLHNLLTISVHKNLILTERSFHTSPKTIRGRLMSYLNSMSLQTHSDKFDIPFDRQQLADYLNVERSALSKELSKMQQDGLISTAKNHFMLKTFDMV